MAFAVAGERIDRVGWTIVAPLINRPIGDLFIALALLGLLLPLPHVHDLHGEVTIVRDLTPDVRRALYQTGATLCGTLLGLTLTSISVLNAALKVDLAELSAGHFSAGKQRRAARLFFATVRSLGLGLIVMLTLLLLDHTQTMSIQGKAVDVAGTDLGQAAFLAIVLLCALRLMRVIWLLGRVLNLSAAPTASTRAAGRVCVSDDEY